MKKAILAVLLSLFCSVAIAQLGTSVEEKLYIYGAKNPFVSTEFIAVDADSKIELKSATALKIKRQGEVSIRIEDKDRNVLNTDEVLKEIKELRQTVEGGSSESTYLFLKSGKFWIYLEQKELLDINGRKVNITTDSTQVVVEVKGNSPTPGPSPTPDVDPDNNSGINDPGFKVLVIVEDRDMTKLSQADQITLRSKEFRDYLNKNCVKGSDGITAEWRVLDQDTVFPPNCENIWCKGLNRPRSELPWIIVNNNGLVYEGPLPNTLQETLDLLKRFKGE
jgi:hypothetical protein